MPRRANEDSKEKHANCLKREFSGPITVQSKAELIQSQFTFDTRLKIALKLPELNNHQFGQVSKNIAVCHWRGDR